MSPEAFLFFTVGLVFGSFGNVLLIRLKKKQSIRGRSKCMTCGKTLGTLDLFPVFSYVFLGGRCRHCASHISLLYPLFELASGTLFLLAAVLHPLNPVLAILTAFLLYALLLASTFDLLHQQLPDNFTAVIGILALIITLINGDIVSSFLGLLLASVWFGGQWYLSHGRAVGTGDIFLAAVLGLWLGLPGTVSMLVLSYVTGAVIILGLLALRVISWKQQRVAFGPFLGLGALLTILGVGQWYVSLVWH